jgi:hypothetical protein
MASCAKCQYKFFTPLDQLDLHRDPVGAELYLLNKFDLHECREEATGRP